MKKKRIKKKSFILLEILLAVSLLAMCSIPLMTNPMHFYKNEMIELEKTAMLNIEKEALFEIKQKLFKNEIPWDDFSPKNRKDVPIKNLPPKHLVVKGFKNKEVPIYYRIWTKKDKPCFNNIDCKYLNIQIAIDTTIKKNDASNKLLPIHNVFAQTANPQEQSDSPE